MLKSLVVVGDADIKDPQATRIGSVFESAVGLDDIAIDDVLDKRIESVSNFIVVVAGIDAEDTQAERAEPVFEPRTSLNDSVVNDKLVE